MSGEGFEPSKHIASDLESLPFDQTRETWLKNIRDGIRTHNPQIRSLVRYPVAPHGLGSAGIWTRIVRFKVWNANHYITKPKNISLVWLEHTTNGFTVHCSANWATVRKIVLAGFEPATLSS